MINKILNNIREKILEIIKELGVIEDLEIFFETPKDPTFGDFSSNIAMRLAKPLRKSPIIIANDIVERVDPLQYHFSKIEVAGNGFINLYLDQNHLANIVFQIIEEKESFGNSDIGKGTNVNIEFVSANPTGYLHIGHGRGAAYGDSLARVLKKVGYQVNTEHYVNDAGNQIHNLTLSIYERYKELYGLEFQLGSDSYHGKEIITIANVIKRQKTDFYLKNPWYNDFREYGLEFLLSGLKHDLKDYNVEFDTWFSEQSLYDNGEVKKTIDYLIDNKYTYEEDGAVWLKTTLYGDEKDRVLVKSDKNLTYLGPDIAYHANKLSRGYDWLIDVFGADHHGHVGPLKAALAFIGLDPSKVDVEIHQMVRVLQNGEEVKMSKRSGKAITLRDLIDEVGSDALRFLYVSKSLNTHMDLDLDLAVKNTNDNPVYYVQYAYARISSLFRVFEENEKEFFEAKEFKTLDVSKISKIVTNLIQYPLVIEEAANKRLPHKITQYLLALAASLHSFYNDEKIITDNIDEVNEKLTVLKAVQIVLKDGLNLIGVGIKEKM